MNPDIWEDLFAITGGLNQVGSVIPALDYWIRIENLWNLVSHVEFILRELKGSGLANPILATFGAYPTKPELRDDA